MSFAILMGIFGFLCGLLVACLLLDEWNENALANEYARGIIDGSLALKDYATPLHKPEFRRVK